MGLLSLRFDKVERLVILDLSFERLDLSFERNVTT